MQPPAPFVGVSDRPRELDQPLILLGASVRAAAQSARRAGIPVIGIDLFGDTDTLAACDRFLRLREVGDLPGLLRSLPPVPVMQVGGLAGEMGLLDHAADRHPVLGPSLMLRRTLKDPRVLANLARGAGLSFPRTIRGDCPQRDTPFSAMGEAESSVRARLTETGAGSTRWLRKDPHQSGGLGVCWADLPRSSDGAILAAPGRFTNPMRRDALADRDDRSCDDRSCDDRSCDDRSCDELWQQWIAGRSYGVSFLGDENSSRVLGICRSCFCRRGRWPFVYAGSVGPVAVAERLVESLGRLGASLTGMGVRGLFGADIIVDRLGRAWLLEINPRWTASSELVERALRSDGTLPADCSLISIARDAFFRRPMDSRASVDDADPTAEHRTIHVKRIVYARRELRVDRTMLEQWNQFRSREPLRIELCDLPVDGSRIRRGEPILTLIAAVAKADEGLRHRWIRQLRSDVRAIQRGDGPVTSGQ